MLYMATVTGYSIDQTYLDIWNSFSSFFTVFNVQGMFAFAKSESTFDTYYDSTFNTGLKKIPKYASGFVLANSWTWMYGLIFGDTYTTDDLFVISTSC